MSAEKIHIERNTVQETLIIPLFSRKLCTETFSDFFTDPKAIELMNRLDYDFSRLEQSSKGAVQKFASLEVATRQKTFILETKNYLKAHPKASVVNLGCGLDQSGESCDNGSCRIYNVDFPDIIKIREELIPTGERVTNISTDLNDLSWFEQVDRENGAVFFASGVFYYFTAEQMEKLINGMAGYFHGGLLMFDISSRMTSKTMIKNWIKQSGINDVFTGFYVDDVKKDIASWLKHAKVSCRPYMTGYFDLHEKSITKLYHLGAWFADHCMKMKIIRIDFD